MASIRRRKENGKLYIDFRVGTVRCREQTALDDTPANRKKLEQLVKRMELDMASGTFVYQNYFPQSKLASQFAAAASEATGPDTAQRALPAAIAAIGKGAMTSPAAVAISPFGEFANKWYEENQVRWRKSYRITVRDVLDKYLIPKFGETVIDQVTKAGILELRSEVAKVPGRKNKAGLSVPRINYIMMILRQILMEAADRFNFTTTFRNIKRLKVPKTDIQPFSLAEVQKILETVRPDYRNYMIVRFFTGMRTGEINGLKWQYVEFEHRRILIRETIVAGEEEYTKTDASQREIQMSEAVYQALRAQAKVSQGISEFVFINADGKPIDLSNFTRRVWNPLLRHLGLKLRRPYQTRHTAATLWLAAGENPQWIARQLGHVSTEMLFNVYARFVPNNTRQDGSAFERLLRESGACGGVGSSEPGSGQSLGSGNGPLNSAKGKGEGNTR